MDEDFRWIQRANHFDSAFAELKEAVELARQRRLSKLESQGLIQGFEYTHELAWNTLKDYFKDSGVEGIHGSVEATRIAFREGVIENGEVWMDMIKKRNPTSHAYNKEVATEVVSAILDQYFSEFQLFQNKLKQLQQHLTP